MPAPEFLAAVRSCRAELRRRGLTLVSSGGYRLDSVPVQARLGRPRWIEGDPPYNWQLWFLGPGATWVPREGMRGTVVYQFSQDEQRRPALDYYPVDTADGAQQFVEDFQRYTLQAIDAASPEALIALLLGRQLAPPGGWGKGRRTNATELAQAVLGIATAYGLRDRVVSEVTDIVSGELTESPQRRERAEQLAAQAGLSLG